MEIAPGGVGGKILKDVRKLKNDARAARDLAFGEVKRQSVYQTAQLAVSNSAPAIDDRDARGIHLRRAIESVAEGDPPSNRARGTTGQNHPATEPRPLTCRYLNDGEFIFTLSDGKLLCLPSSATLRAGEFVLG